MSLHDRTILITRQREQSIAFIAEIEKRGGKAVLLPLITIQDPVSWEELDRALQRLKEYDALLFTSSNGVEKFFQRCVLRSIEPVLLRHCAIYAVGEKTRQGIEGHGLPVRATPSTFSSAGLGDLFASVDVRGKKFLYPRGDLGKADLIKSLIRQGAIVDPVVVYRNTGPDEVEAELVYGRLVEGEINVITFASPSAAVNFVKLFSPEKIASIEKKTKIAVVGPTTAEAVTGLGLHPDIVAARATTSGILDAIEDYFETP